MSGPFRSFRQSTSGNEIVAANIIVQIAEACRVTDSALLLAERLTSGETLSDADRATLTNIPDIRAHFRSTATELERLLLVLFGASRQELK